MATVLCLFAWALEHCCHPGSLYAVRLFSSPLAVATCVGALVCLLVPLTLAVNTAHDSVAPVFGAVVFVFGGLALTYALDRYETRNIVSGEYFNHWWMLLAVACE